MFVLLICGDNQGFYGVYRNPQEGASLQEERKITAYVEADQHHIANIVNFVCSWIWVDIITNTPSVQSPITKLKTN